MDTAPLDVASDQLPDLEPAAQVIAPLAGGQSRTQLKKVHYNHDALIDAIIADPTVRQRALAEQFGMTEAWISTVTCSDAFQARLAARRSDLVGNSMLLNYNERLRRMAIKSLDRVELELDKQMNCDVDVALEGLKIAAKTFGAPQTQVTTNNTNNTQFVVQMPGKARDAVEWAKAYGAQEGGLLAETANTLAVPPMPPALEALCVNDPMDVLGEIMPVGSPPDVQR